MDAYHFTKRSWKCDMNNFNTAYKKLNEEDLSFISDEIIDSEMMEVDQQIQIPVNCDIKDGSPYNSNSDESSDDTDINISYLYEQLYNKSNITVKEASMLLFTFKLKFALSNICFEKLLGLVKYLLPYDNKLPSTLKSIEENIQKKESKIQV